MSEINPEELGNIPSGVPGSDYTVKKSSSQEKKEKKDKMHHQCTKNLNLLYLSVFFLNSVP